MERWKVGELAEATGLTVRTLHHYEELGLVGASERTSAGYRSYTPDDVRRLYRVIALRSLGLSLKDVGALLDGDGVDPRGALRRQLDDVERRIADATELRERLRWILEQMEDGTEPSTDDLLDVIGRTTMHEKYYTPEQLEWLEVRRRELGDEGMERAQQEWAELIAAVTDARTRGVDPADPEAQDLARRWRELIEAFTGGDPGIRQSLQRMYEQEGSEEASRGAVSQEAMAYMGRVMDAGG